MIATLTISIAMLFELDVADVCFDSYSSESDQNNLDAMISQALDVICTYPAGKSKVPGGVVVADVPFQENGEPDPRDTNVCSEYLTVAAPLKNPQLIQTLAPYCVSISTGGKVGLGYEQCISPNYAWVDDDREWLDPRVDGISSYYGVLAGELVSSGFMSYHDIEDIVWTDPEGHDHYYFDDYVDR